MPCLIFNPPVTLYEMGDSRMKQTLQIFSVFSMVAFIGTAQAAPGKKCVFQDDNHAQKIPGIVERVSDGDTVSVTMKGYGKQSIRLLSIDTPELHFPLNGRMHNQGPIAQTATDFVNSQIKTGDEVMIELDVEPCDTYGRVLGYIWKGKTNLNQLIVEKSMAVNYCIAPNLKHCEEFSKVVAKTSTGKAGVFGVPGLQEPYFWRAQLRGEGLTKYVADIRTKKVYQPDAAPQIPVAYRVFFIKSTDVKPPFTWAQ